MKVIVTGGCGFIGHNLVRDLLDNTWSKWEILVIDDLSTGKEWNRWENVTYVHSPIQWTNKNQTTIDHWVQEWNPSCIFHLAAVPRVSYSVEHPLETTESNILSTMAVLDAARKFGKHDIRVIFSSSSSVYGGADVLPTPTSYPSNPKSPYAMQKWQGEEWCRMYASLYELDVVCLRYFNVIGQHSYYGGAYSTVLSAWMYHLFVDPDSVPFLEGDGTQSRDFCAVKNVTQANILAALYDKDRFFGESFNVAQGQAHTLLECKELLETISGKTLNLEMRPPRIGDVDHTLADIKETSGVLEYVPDTDFENQVKQMADWYATSYRQN